MANFKMAGFDKINDDLPNNTPFTTAESSTIKVNFDSNFRQVSYSRHRLNDAPSAILSAKSSIDKLCAQTTQAYKPDKVVVRTKVINNTNSSTKSRPSSLKKETFKSAADKQPNGAEVVGEDKTPQVISELSISKPQIVKDGSTNYEIITDPMLPDVDESDQVKAVNPNKVQAAAQYPVQIIEFYPQGWGVGRDDLARLSNMSTSAGRFYQYQIQGQTLNMLPARVATGQKDLSYYLNYCGWIKQIAGCTRGSLTSILYGIYETDGVALGASGKSTVIYLPMQINDPAACGISFGPNTRFAVVDHATYRCNGANDLNPENGTMVHEMGHTFGLGHAPSQYAFDIMGVSSARCVYGPPSNCWLNNAERQKIATPKYFQPDPIYTAGYSLVHRIFNGNNGKHLYSNDIAEINEDLRNGWYWDGISWMIYPSAKTGTKQLTRFYDPAGDNRVMTIDDTEKLNIQPPRGRWLPESYPVMYAMPTATADMPTAINRIYNPINGDRIYTLDPQEIRNTTAAGWLNEGVRFWAKRY